MRRASRCVSPSTSTTLARVRTAMLSVVSIWAMRYCDMLSASDGPRTRMVTSRAYLERYIAAWPAELPAPTMNALFPCASSASGMAAP